MGLNGGALLRHEGLRQLLKTDVLPIWNLKALLVALGVSDHANLHLHFPDSCLADFHLISLGLSLTLQGVDRLEQQLTVMPLLPDFRLHLLVVGVDLWLDLTVDVFDLLAELVHQGVRLMAQLLGLLFELFKQFETKHDLGLQPKRD